jgi:hypothetical protein
MAVKITTDGVPIPIIEARELTAEEREQFDYLDWPAIDDGRDSASFFRYNGELHDLGEFSADFGITRGTGLPDEMAGWHGYRSDSFFSALLVRLVDEDGEVTDGEYTHVIVGLALS